MNFLPDKILLTQTFFLNCKGASEFLGRIRHTRSERRHSDTGRIQELLLDHIGHHTRRRLLRFPHELVLRHLLEQAAKEIKKQNCIYINIFINDVGRLKTKLDDEEPKNKACFVV